MVDPSGLFSKLPRQVTRMHKVHRAIRTGNPIHTLSPRTNAKQRVDVSEAALLAAETQHLEGATLREVAGPLGISHMRLASLLKKRGVRIRSCSPTPKEVDEMVHRYEHGESLARIGTKLGYQPNTVRTHLYMRGIQTRDSHGRPK